MKRILLASAAIFMTASFASAQDTLVLPTTIPAAPVSTPTALMPIPLPNNGVAVIGQHGSTAGMIIHQPLGHGYTSNSGTVVLPSGNGFGANVITGPNGSPIGGGLSIQQRF